MLDPGIVGRTSAPRFVTWNERDAALYALGVGAGVDDLQFTTENTDGIVQQTLPTMPVALSLDFRLLDEATPIDWANFLHAEQSLEIEASLPPSGTAVVTDRIAEVWDKGSAALVVVEGIGDTHEGARLFRTRSSYYIPGAGGWGGERGPRSSWERPSTAPDATVTYGTRPEQALIYRLSGDGNRLHSDPAFAHQAGFPRPILHGLCTYGFTARAILELVPRRDPAAVRFLSARFVAAVYPGDTLHVDIWRMNDDLHFETRRDDGQVVLSHGVASIGGLRSERLRRLPAGRPDDA